MKHDRFIKRWKSKKARGFKAYVLMTSVGWTLIMFPLLKFLNWYLKDENPFDYTQLWWEVPMFLMSGICLALVFWIVNNYLYAKYTGEFTPENHHHHHD